MEVRCEKCNKLFRVSDDKMTGAGIKFPCTRCGAYVKIKSGDFEHYTLSHGAVSVLDLFEAKPKPAPASLSPEVVEPAAGETASPENQSKTFDFAEQTTHENALEEKAPLFVEPDHFESAPAAKPEPAVEVKPETLMPVKSKAELTVEKLPEQTPEPKSEPEPLFVPQHQSKPVTERETPPPPPMQPAVPKREYAHPATPTAPPAAERIIMEPVHSSMPSRSGRMLVVLFAALIIAGLAAYGIFLYLQSSPPSLQKGREAAREITSIEGLQIVNPVGSMEANGDLLITGVIENATVKERPAWYVLAVVNDAQGAELAKIRMLNGQQIFTRRDYDILAGRGVNVQELKAKVLQEKGVVIPPMGSVKFEVRYLQPPPGVTGFHAQLLPFDPVQMNKEIAAETN
jgi:phage FluMu protein Com